MEESAFLIAEDYMKQVIRLGWVFGAVGNWYTDLQHVINKEKKETKIGKEGVRKW